MPTPVGALDRDLVDPLVVGGVFDGITVAADGLFLFGHAFDPRPGRTAEAVVVFQDGRQVPGNVRVFRQRADVAIAMNRRELVASGWSLWIPHVAVGAGEHVFEAYAVFGDGTASRLAGEHRVSWPPERPAATPAAPAAALPPPIPDRYCGSLDGAKRLDDGRIFVWGWAFDQEAGAAVRAVTVTAEGVAVSPGAPAVSERPDVAAALGEERARNSGWSVYLRGDAGDHTFAAVATLADGASCSLGGTVVVAAATP